MSIKEGINTILCGWSLAEIGTAAIQTVYIYICLVQFCEGICMPPTV